MIGTVLSLGTYTAHAEVAPGGGIELTVFVSTDPGPAKHFRPCLTARMDEAHGSELLGTLALALRDVRDARSAPAIMKIEGPSS